MIGASTSTWGEFVRSTQTRRSGSALTARARALRSRPRRHPSTTLPCRSLRFHLVCAARQLTATARVHGNRALCSTLLAPQPHYDLADRDRTRTTAFEFSIV